MCLKKALHHNNKGYTLVELLAVVTILVAVTGIIAALITQTLRGGGKSQITNDVAQAGNYAVSAITNTVITAEDVVEVIDSGGKSITDCRQNPKGRSITLYVSDQIGTVRYACMSIDSTFTVASNSASLFDTSRLKVTPNSCYFSCSQADNDPYTPPIIKFGFTVLQKSNSTLFENKASAPFETSVLMRNYRQK